MDAAHDPRLTVEPPLRDYTETHRQPKTIAWYRSPLPPGEMKRLHERSDLLGAAQTLGYLACYAAPAALTIWAWSERLWWLAAAAFFVQGMVGSFLINGVHELGHGTVFRTKRLNSFFCHLLAFLGWINHEWFQASHVRHHRYTLHPPDDLEVTLPIKLAWRQWLRTAIFNWRGLPMAIRGNWLMGRGRIDGEWSLTLFPPDRPELRRAPVRWARVTLLGHSAVLVAGIATGWWILPIVVSLAPFVGNGLFWLCNNTQHVGLQDNVPDFRLSCRTFTLNPVVRFLYWHMNFHTEHHMYAAVPCYRLGRLHQLIRHDLPPTPDGLAAVWREIMTIMRRQEADPNYVHDIPLPPPAPGGAAARGSA